MKVYRGERLGPREQLPEVKVTVNDMPLKHRVRHSPTGFEWGYNGSGPADLALSILWDLTGKEPLAVFYQAFKEELVSKWKDEWKITDCAITIWLEQRAERLSIG